MTLIDCKFVRFRKLKVEKVRKNDAFWRFSKQLDNIWQNQLKCPLLLLLRHFWCCHYYHPSLLLSLSYNPPSEISHVEKCIHLHSSGTIQVFNRVNIKDLPPDLSPTLKVSFSQKGLMHLSFLQTGKPNYFPELKFWILFPSKWLKSCQKRTLSCSNAFWAFRAASCPYLKWLEPFGMKKKSKS